MDIATGTGMNPSCQRDDVDAYINNSHAGGHTAVDGDLFTLGDNHASPTSCRWTNGVTFPSGIGIQIIGAGTTDAHNRSGDGTHTTTIIDCATTASPCSGTQAYLFNSTPSASASITRFSSFTLDTDPGLTGTKDLNPPFGISATTSTMTPYSAHIRIDHIVIPGANWGQATNSSATLIVADNVYGVIDHNSLYHTAGSTYEWVNFNNSAWHGVGNWGDNSWAQGESFGTTEALYVETNWIEQTDGAALGIALTETESGFGTNHTGEGGGRVVCRFNTFNGVGIGCSNHGTETNQRARGGRSMEFYKNQFNCPSSAPSSICNASGYDYGAQPRSGSLLSIDNHWANVGATQFGKVVQDRYIAHFNIWGGCDGSGPYDDNDPMVYDSGTITGLVDNVTTWAITDNTKSWTANEWDPFVNVAFAYSFHDIDTGGTMVGDGATIYTNSPSSAGGNTLRVLNSEGSGFGANSFHIGDRYQILHVLRCLDTSSRIGGTLLSMLAPTPTNTSGGYVFQSLSPVYEADETGTNFGGFLSTPPNLAANTDFYQEVSQTVNSCSGHSPNTGCTPFDGSSGTGYGTLANMPSTCPTAGTGYWATDSGSWNTSGSGGQGQLYTCQGGVFVLYYTPLAYPHPDINNSLAISSQPASQNITPGTATMSVTATGGTAPYTYQWYVGMSGDTSTPISMATMSSYITPSLTVGTHNYWVAVTDSAGSPATVDSNTAVITVGNAPTISVQPASQSITSGNTANLIVTASGSGTLIYQWYRGTAPDTTNPVGTNSSSFTTPSLTVTTSYWVDVSSVFGDVHSNTATITVSNPMPMPSGGGDGCRFRFCPHPN